MAESRKKNQTNRQKNSKGNTTPKNVGMTRSPYQDEIILVVALVISILLLLSFFNLCGAVGKGVKYFLFGSVGLTAYLLPFILFFGIAFAISNRGIATAKVKIISSIVLYIILSAMIELITNGYDIKSNIIASFANSAKYHNGGGVIGASLSRSLCFLFGEFGTYVVLVGLIAILCMFITEKLLFAGLKERRAKNAKRRAERRSELAYEEEEPEEESHTRKAKVYTFSKEEKEFVPDKNKVIPLKDSKKMSKAEKKDNLDNLTIFRGYEKKETISETKLPIYEEELKKKFKEKEDSDNFVDDIKPAEPLILREKEPEIKTVPTLSIPENTAEETTLPAIEDIREEIPPIFPKVLQEEILSQPETVPEETVIPSKEDIPKRMPELSPKKAEESKNPADKKDEIPNEISQSLHEKKENYVFPPLDLLNMPKTNKKGTSDEELKNTAAKLKSTLDSFGVRVEMKNISCGPAVTRYELQPAQGVKVSKITSLTDDIKLSLAAADIRIEAPIPGKSAVGIEVPNREVSMVYLRSLLESKEFKEHKSDIAFAVGKDIGGNTVVTDIAKMPHLLIAGATGSGKSVCINTLIMSILYKANPEDVKLIMVDPKVVELSVYNGIPHLLIPVVTDPKKASGALNWAVVEMTDRYKKFADLGVRDIKGYNAKVSVVEEDNDERFRKLPQIVIIVDELADLMMVAPGEVEDAICRLAQLARAAGIHLIIATQRPSVNVITGLIKANIPSRVAFAVSSAIDSRTILDGGGAEKLLGNGDMLFFPSGYPKPVRVQGSYVSDKEVSEVVQFLTDQYGKVEYSEEIDSKIASSTVSDSGQAGGSDRDEYFAEAGKFIIEKDKASIGMLQRVYKIGFNRAARIMDQLYDAGVVGPEEGTKPRKIIMTMEEFEQYIEDYV